jgi:small-conductance mechanosensitive channel
MLESVLKYIGHIEILPAVRTVAIALAGFVVARLVSGAVIRVLGKRLDRQQLPILRRILYYGILLLFLMSALRELGFDLSVLVGAAGILTVAVGFASQTSASNLISGLFLIAERPFAVGDTIKVGEFTGEVLAIDLLSIKLRTFDNLYVRIPNEQMIKTEVVNLTKFPIRRVDIAVGVAYREDLGLVKAMLLGLADRHPLCLEEPRPIVYFAGFGESSIDLKLLVWTRRENHLELWNSLHEQIKLEFDRNAVEIPFPNRTIHPAALTEPFPVRVVAGAVREETGRT